MQTGPYLIMRLLGAGLVFVLVANSGIAQERIALNKDPHIHESLMSVKIGSIIQKRCSEISPRIMKAMGKARALQKYALDLGYTKAELKAFVTDDEENKRIKLAAHAYLDERGAVRGEEAGYCAIGHNEIANGTMTGKLLSSS